MYSVRCMPEKHSHRRPLAISLKRQRPPLEKQLHPHTWVCCLKRGKKRCLHKIHAHPAMQTFKPLRVLIYLNYNSLKSVTVKLLLIWRTTSTNHSIMV